MQIDLQCAGCKHNKGNRQCVAFPEWIPDAIFITGQHDHRTPFPGDNGVCFEPDGTDAQSAKAWVEEDHPRHPAGTPVDPESGAGGGRFAPKEAGRPEGVFGERPDDPYMKALDKHAARLATLRNEELLIFDENGELVLSVIGQHAQVELDDDAFNAAYGRFQVHNHPSASSFSDVDFVAMAATRAPGIAVVAGDYIYRLDLPPEFYEKLTALFAPGADWRTSTVLDDWQMVHSWIKTQRTVMEGDLRSVMQPLVSAGDISLEEASVVHTDLMFSRQQEWFAGLGGKLTRIERVPGFFAEAGPEDLPALEAANARIANGSELSFAPDSTAPRQSERFILVTDNGRQIGYPVQPDFADEMKESGVDPAGAALVLSGVHRPRPHQNREVMGAPPLDRLMGAVDAGINTFYFGGVAQAYRLRVRNAAGLDSDSFRRAQREIVFNLTEAQNDNERQATDAFGYRDDLLHLRATDTAASDAIVNHLALIELAARFPSVIEYKGMYYPDHNAKTLDPYDLPALRRLVE